VKLGEHPALTLEQARQKARLLLELVRQDSDPELARAESRRANLEATRQTVRDIHTKMVRKDIRRQTNVVRSYLQAAFTDGT
jgi:hypothetical protein